MSLRNWVAVCYRAELSVGGARALKLRRARTSSRVLLPNMRVRVHVSSQQRAWSDRLVPHYVHDRWAQLEKSWEELRCSAIYLYESCTEKSCLMPKGCVIYIGILWRNSSYIGIDSSFTKESQFWWKFRRSATLKFQERWRFLHNEVGFDVMMLTFTEFEFGVFR